MGLALLAQSKLPNTYWIDAFNTSVYLINRLPSLVLNDTCAYTKLLNKVHDYSFLKVFGCCYYSLLKPYNNHKLMYRSKKCIFICYCSNYRACRCVDPMTRKILTSRNVIFDEHTFLAQDWKPFLLKYSARDLPQHVSILYSNDFMLPIPHTTSTQCYDVSVIAAPLAKMLYLLLNHKCLPPISFLR